MHTGPRLSFDRLAQVFDDQRSLPATAVEALHEVFSELAHAGVETLIELGAGTGRITIPALAAGLRVTALDISQPMLDAMQVRLGTVPEIAARCQMVVGDATSLPFIDSVFDAGVLAQVLYLIPGWTTALDDLIRVVRSGGVVMLLQERTTMSPALTIWDAAWRAATEAVGYVPISQEPDDETAVAALAERVGPIEERVLATWGVGQRVGDALTGLDRLRPLYASLPDAQWVQALEAFRAWVGDSKLASDDRLDGTVELTLVSGTVT